MIWIDRLSSSIPLLSLLGFVLWTLLLVFSIAGWRVSRVLGGKAPANAFPADVAHGPDLYRRLLRAHVNCVENLPLFAAVVLLAHVARPSDTFVATLAPVYLAARVAQTLAHLSSGRSFAVQVRFTFFLVQLVVLLVLIGYVALPVLRLRP